MLRTTRRWEIHDGEADGIADRSIATDLAVVGVHVVDGEAQVAETVALEHIAFAGDDEDTVAPEADIVVLDPCSRRVPNRDAVAGLIDAFLCDADDRVSPRNRVLGAVQADAVEVAFDPVGLDDGAGRGLLNEDAGIQGYEIPSGATQGKPAHDGAGGGNEDDAAAAFPVDNGVLPPFERDLAFDAHATAMFAFDDDRVTVRRAIQRGLE